MNSPDADPHARRHAPAADRNAEPILNVLREVLPPTANVLEIGSGTGQHALAFARALPGIRWQPSDADPEALPSIAAWRGDGPTDRIAPPLKLDVEIDPWPTGPFDALVAINVVHISPWSTALALLDGAKRVLGPGGLLVLYGPYRRGGQHTAPSNAAFDASLRQRNAAWGVRDMEAVAEEASARGFSSVRVEPMPANNFTLVFAR